MVSNENQTVYFIGIGGISMSALAAMTLDFGKKVCGSDRSAGSACDELVRRGAEIYCFHARENILKSRPQLVVYSMSIAKDNPELLCAAEQGIPAVSRGEYMGMLCKEYKLKIAVAGSHGKTTVTALIGEAMDTLNPTALIGAPIKSGLGLKQGARDVIVYEACEYKNSFLSMPSDIAIMLNLDMDHTDFFHSIEELKTSFLAYANSAARLVIINYDDENLMALRPLINTPCITFGRDASADYSYNRCGDELQIIYNGEIIASPCPRIFGEHNLMNICVAVAACHACGCLSRQAIDALSCFRGVPRRLEYIGKYEGCNVYYDYAHHPREITATAESLTGLGYRKILAIFAPHTYSRTAYFMRELSESLADFFDVIVVDIFPAREAPIAGVTSEALAKAVRRLGTECKYISADRVLSRLEPCQYDALVLMGAGELEPLISEIFERISK